MTGAFDRDDYYRILQVDPEAHPEIVRAAYRTLLRVLGKHPDLGGTATEAATIIEAYRTLSDARRRVAYDQFLRAHSRRASLPGARREPPAPAARVPVTPSPGPGLSVPPGVLNWIRHTLPEFRLAPRARFAKSFDLVLERPSWLAPRLYVKAVPPITRADWATIFVLCRAVRVARDGIKPSMDTILIVTRSVEGPEAFVEETRRHAAPCAWNRTAIALLTLSPPDLHAPAVLSTSRVLRRLRDALTGIDVVH